MPIGVIGRVRPCARLKQKYARSPGGPCGMGWSVVIGRAWVSHSVPLASIAHSGVLRRSVMVLDLVPELGQREHLRVGEARRVVLGRDMLDSASGQGSYGHALVTQPPLQDPPVPYDEMVGIDRPRHDGFAEAGAGVDDRFAAAAGHRVGGEHDARHLGLDHLLDDDRQPDRPVVDPVRRPVRHRPVGPQ
ncbi:hypothetical protein GCM10009555_045210 [Acrocarpospora macrocephala]|uniref:Uncharacterized protein n=1 Tax=Acrocarpospora macrocephala TaxID=150177 RepID=A0A5M3WCM9_9ACTN|nr:hypothetical protein Amac_004120 [Acrocarpospora macrocephala]